MDTREIAHVLSSNRTLREISLGVFASDCLPTVRNAPACFVANEDDSTKDGSHWVGFYFPTMDTCDYFDSYGRLGFGKYLKTYETIWNTKQVQNYGTSVCGQHTLHVLYARAHGVAYHDIIKTYTGDLEANDQMVCQFVNDTFDLNIPVRDVEFIEKQIATSFDAL